MWIALNIMNISNGLWHWPLLDLSPTPAAESRSTSRDECTAPPARLGKHPLSVLSTAQLFVQKPDTASRSLLDPSLLSLSHCWKSQAQHCKYAPWNTTYQLTFILLKNNETKQPPRPPKNPSNNQLYQIGCLKPFSFISLSENEIRTETARSLLNVPSSCPILTPSANFFRILSPQKKILL